MKLTLKDNKYNFMLQIVSEINVRHRMAYNGFIACSFLEGTWYERRESKWVETRIVFEKFDFLKHCLCLNILRRKKSELLRDLINQTRRNVLNIYYTR